jgi:hypothetical protein
LLLYDIIRQEYPLACLNGRGERAKITKLEFARLLREVFSQETIDLAGEASPDQEPFAEKVVV